MCTENLNNLEEINKELSTIQHEIINLKNKEYTLNSKKVDLLKYKCKENIGRCFIKMKDNKIISYCKIINIDNPADNGVHINQAEHFNEYQYPALWFIYPYNNSKMPFYKDNLFSGAWGEGNDCINYLNKISYVEITKEEFLEKFKEVNDLWVSKISN